MTLYPFNRPPIEMIDEASIHPGGLDGFHISTVVALGYGEMPLGEQL